MAYPNSKRSVKMPDNFNSLSAAFSSKDGLAAGSVLSRSVLTLCVYDLRGRPVRVGSCILLRVDGRLFVVTAGHVVLQTRDVHVYIGFPGTTLQRVPTLVRHASCVTGEPEVDELDLGLMPLQASKIDGFSSAVFLDVDSVDVDHVPDMQRQPAADYLVYGYSAARSQVKVDHRARVLHQTSFQLATSAAQMDKYSEEKIDPRNHLLLDHDRKDVLVGGQIRTMVQMNGVSGGAVIYYSPAGVAAVVGVVIEHRKSRRLIVATRMGPVLAIARKVISTSDPAVFL
jgi:hypothetical protein